MSQQQPTLSHGQQQPQPIQQQSTRSKRSTSPTKRSSSPTKQRRSPSPTKQERSPSPTKQQRSSSPSSSKRSPSPTKKQRSSGSVPKSNITIRQNFSDESENLINQLINNILFNCYSATSMAYYFDRQDIGMFGMANFYRWCAREGYQCARLLMDYLVVRGGEVQFKTIKKPEKDEWGTPLESLEYLVELKKVINQQVLKVHSSACENNDAHLQDFLETVILRPLVEFVRKVAVLITNLERAGSKLGEYQFNKDLELYLVDLMRDVKVSSLPITAVGAPVPSVGSLLTPPTVSPLGPSKYVPGFGVTTPNFNLTDVINLISNIGLNPMGHKSFM
jgi:ferritin